MIVTEYYKTRKDGVVLNRTYSDEGWMIERDGVRYAEAVDPAELNRTYTEVVGVSAKEEAEPEFEPEPSPAMLEENA